MNTLPITIQVSTDSDSFHAFLLVRLYLEWMYKYRNA